MKARIFLSLVVLLMTVSFLGNSTSEAIKSAHVIKEDLSDQFGEYEGCFVLLDQEKNQYTIYNYKKAKKQVSPCSTFKIMNTLIGLDAGILQDENTTFLWDGTDYKSPSWNKDQTLAEAVKNSTFWYFQQNAKLVGPERMQYYLDQMKYGNRDISGGLTVFWEQSSLKISPIEQVQFLQKIHEGKTIFSQSTLDVLKKVIWISEKDGAVLSGKTGSGLREEGRFIPEGPEDGYVRGWFVGYVEKDGNTYYVATLIEGEDQTYGGKAREITLRILKDKGIY